MSLVNLHVFCKRKRTGKEFSLSICSRGLCKQSSRKCQSLFVYKCSAGVCYIFMVASFQLVPGDCPILQPGKNGSFRGWSLWYYIVLRPLHFPYPALSRPPAKKNHQVFPSAELATLCMLEAICQRSRQVGLPASMWGRWNKFPALLGDFLLPGGTAHCCPVGCQGKMAGEILGVIGVARFLSVSSNVTQK